MTTVQVKTTMMKTMRKREKNQYNHLIRNKKQLSAQDVQVARETAELFKSNIFKLQIDELMKE